MTPNSKSPTAKRLKQFSAKTQSNIEEVIDISKFLSHNIFTKLQPSFRTTSPSSGHTN